MPMSVWVTEASEAGVADALTIRAYSNPAGVCCWHIE